MKLSKRLKKIIAQQYRAMIDNKQIAACLEGGCDRLPDWFKKNSSDYYHGMADTRAGIISSILMEHNCYDGFQEKTEEVFGFEYTYERFFFEFDINEFAV